MLGAVQISGEEIGDVDTKDICDSLRNNSIRLLSLRGCQMNDNNFRKIMESVKDSTSLVHLNLNLGVISSKDRVTWLADGIERNHNLTVLLLHGNNLGDFGMSKLSASLENHPRVQTLDVGDCQLGDEAINSLCTLLKHRKTLTELTLTGNRNVTDAGWAQLAMALANGTNLRKLYLDYNNIGDFGAGLFAVALSAVKGLALLDLEGTGISDVGGDMLCDAIENHNTTLQELGLDNNDLSEEVLNEIKECLQENINSLAFNKTP